MTTDGRDSDQLAGDGGEDGGPTTPAIEAVRAAGIGHTVTRHGPVTSLEQAAAVRGIEPRDLIKTLVAAPLGGRPRLRPRAR